MRKKLLYICLFFIILLSCKQKNSQPVLPDLTKDEINGSRLWQRIAVESDYDEYPMWPDHAGMQLGMSPHGRYHEVYINEKLLAAVPNPDRIAPYGSICIKENFTAGKELISINAMAKVEGYDPENGNWFWVMYDKGGKAMAEGKLPMCINCHAASDNDYITIRKLDKPLK